jgi:hypothetical protein
MQDDEDDVFNDNGTLKSGKRWRVPMQMMDAMQRDVASYIRQDFRKSPVVPGSVNGAIIADGDGGMLGLCRPGVRIDGGNRDRLVRDEARDEIQRAYDESDALVQNAWRNAPTGFGSGEFRGAREGDLCTINGSPGHLKLIDGTLRCVPDKRNDAQSSRDALSSAYLSAEAWLSDAWKHP